MSTKRRSVLSGMVLGAIFLLLLGACTPQAKVSPTQVVSGTQAIPATGGGPSVTVSDQSFDGTTVVVADVVSQGPGWMAIHNQEEGHLGPVIGVAPVKDGLNKDVSVKLDPAKATPVLYAMLHADAGVVGTYEFPGPDVPILVDGQMVAPPFKATVGETLSKTSSITVHDQDVVNGKITIDQVVSDGAGWLDIHIQKPDGTPGEDIGFTAVKDGTNTNVVVTIDASKMTPVMYAMLHVDAGEIGAYEDRTIDKPQTVNGETVMQPFKSSLQASGPVVASAATPTTAAQANPTAAAAPTEMVMPTAASEAPPAEPTAAPSPAPEQGQSNIQVQDQPVQDGGVVVPEVDTPESVWLVIHLQNKDGSMGEFIGFTKVPAGVSKNVPVKVDTNRVTPVLYAMLHRDLGTIGRLEFPGPDVPVEVNGQMLTPPFNIVSEASAPANGDVSLTVSTAGSGIGHLVDGKGNSLYIFLRDTPGKSNCTGECAQEWKPLLATGRISSGDGVDPVKVGVILLPDGNRQITYSGSPLYTYVKDSNPGDITGQGLGGLWFLVNP